MAPGDQVDLIQLITLARLEDLGAGDITTALFPDAHRRATFRLITKQPCVFAGRTIAPTVLNHYDPTMSITWSELTIDGTVIGSGAASSHTTLATITGPLASILAVERVLLNFLQRLCGIATITRAFVDAVTGTGAKVYDTRKTIPGWRSLDKYAVRCGGGHNHRTGLFDAVLIKENHLHGVPPNRLAATVFEALNRLAAEGGERDGRAAPFVEVEAESIQQVEQLFKVIGIDAVLLDNFTVEKMHEAVALREAHGLSGKIVLEASGGITLSNVRAAVDSGVERISVGVLTHSAPAIDLSLERVE